MGKNVYSQYKDIPHICYACGSIRTNFNSKGKPNWFLNLDLDKNVVGMLCQSCYQSVIRVPALTAKGYYKQYIRFKDEQIHVGKFVREGLCQHCGKTGYTHLHHEQYDIENILRHTIELCPSCHAKESWRLDAFARGDIFNSC